MNNFQLFLELKKPEHDHRDDRQQELYTAVTRRPLRNRYEDSVDTITLITDNTEVKVDPELLMSCVRGSRIPIRDIKTIKAKLGGVEDWMWDVFSLLTSGGAVIEDIYCSIFFYRADYSPVIHEMIQQGKLLKLR